MEFGVLSMTNGVHVTLPYEIGGRSVSGMVVRPEDAGASQDIRYDW